MEEGTAGERSRRWGTATAGGIAGLMLGLMAAALFFHRGLTVVVYNADAAPLLDCVVYTTGHSYPVGDIRPGQSARVRVGAAGESHVEIEFRDADGSRKRSKADCYFEGGYSGTIAITLNRQGVISTIDDISLW